MRFKEPWYGYQEKKIDELPVVDKNKRPVGLLDVQDLLKAGLV